MIEAYLRGLERRVAAGEPVTAIASVASFFVSRIDAKADAVLAPDSPLRGRVAIANAQRAYGRYLRRFAGPRWQPLAAAGARPQRPLWASTGTKDPSYSDVLYVEGLIAPGVINTMPEKTLRAFADHGDVGSPLGSDPSAADAVLAAAAAAGVDLDAITRTLEREGVHAFCDAYEQLLRRIVHRHPRRSLMTSTVGAALRPAPIPTASTLRGDPVVQAFTLLRIAFTVAPILFGLDKFAGVLTDDWTRYLAPAFNDIIPGSAADAMHIVGVIEIAAGLTVAIAPRFGGLLVAAWLGGIIVNLLIVGGYGDIALRDFGLMLGALTLARLATVADGGGHGANCALRRSPEGCGGVGIGGVWSLCAE